jgi:hypothetical protein
MALTKEDLQAIGALLDTKLDGALDSIRADLDKLNQTVARIEVDHGQKLGALYDAHIDTVRNATTIQELEAKLDDHDARLFALEQKASNG